MSGDLDKAWRLCHQTPRARSHQADDSRTVSSGGGDAGAGPYPGNRV